MAIVRALWMAGVLALAPAGRAEAPARARDLGTTPLAITIDDLPAHGPLPPGRTRAGVIRSLAAALNAAGASAHGFFNADFGRSEPGYDAALAAWRASGLPLGNHGRDHLDLDQVGAAAFLADLDGNEAPLARAAPPGGGRWFRYPFLHEGADPAVRDTVRAGLGARGYRIAAVSMSFADYNWQSAWAACSARGDQVALRRLRNGFLADARTAALAARQNLDPGVPQVLLLHAGAMTADLLPQLLAQYRRLGFRFVGLAAAQQHPRYVAANNPALPGPTPPPPAVRLAGPSTTCTFPEKSQ